MTLDATESSAPGPRVARAAGTRVSLSKWVNEKSPAWSEILSAYDVTRLTRRHRWLVHTLTFLGRFPKRQRFHSRGPTQVWKPAVCARRLNENAVCQCRRVRTTWAGPCRWEPPRWKHCWLQRPKTSCSTASNCSVGNVFLPIWRNAPALRCLVRMLHNEIRKLALRKD